MKEEVKEREEKDSLHNVTQSLLSHNTNTISGKLRNKHGWHHNAPLHISKA